MHRVKSSALIVALLVGVAPARAGDLGPLEPLADLHRAVHESLGLPEPLIVQLLERGLPEEHLPVIGLISTRTATAPERIFEMRRSGLSFLDISLRLGAGPEIFYVPIERAPGPPYGKAWGHYAKTPRALWRTIVLTDADIVHLANLRLCVDRYGVAPDRVIGLGSAGKGVAAIHTELARAGKPGKPAAAEAQGKPKGKGPKKDKDKDRERGRG